MYQLTYDPQKVVYMADYMMAFLRETESLEHEKNKGILAIGNVRKKALKMQPPKKQVSIDRFYLAGWYTPTFTWNKSAQKMNECDAR